MDQEVNRATYLGVAMVVVVTLAAAVALTLTLGRGMMNNFTEKLAELLGLKGGTIKIMEDTITPMSAASAQLYIAENLDYIDLDESKMKVVLYGDPASVRTDLGLITTKAKGDVLLEVRRLTSGRYYVYVHRYNCNLAQFGGTCNCSPQH